MESYYRKQLAYIHDTYYGDLARNAATEILNTSTVLFSKKAVDLGCGSGILASVLSENGIKVSGIDLSSDLLEIAKTRSPESTFIHGSLFDYPFEFVDIICAIGEPFNYLFDNKTNYSELTKLIHTIYTHLNPSGLFLFDILTDEVDTEHTIRIIEKEDLTLFPDIEVDSKKTVLTRKMIYFLRKNNCYEKDAEIHRQFLFNVAKIENILSEVGFRYERLNGYNGLGFRKGHYGFLCRKQIA
ncbi:MAG: class I SAM-dependent methyltransferase [Spirosomataceae bacterium]